LADLLASPREAKKGLQANLPNEIVQEIETLLGRQAVQDLDFEALETAAPRQALRLAAHALEQWLNAGASDHAAPELPCPVEGRPNIMASIGRHLYRNDRPGGLSHLFKPLIQV
jgi:hypothetical protein